MSNKYDGHDWIRVKKHEVNLEDTWEERFEALESHHEQETSFLIHELRKLGVPVVPAEPEKNKRLAQTELPGGRRVDREWTPHERYQLYARGLRDGAGGRPIDKDCEGLGAYDRGYDDGILTRRNHVSAYAKEVGYKPSILRAEAGGTPCPNCLMPLAMGCDCATRKD